MDRVLRPYIPISRLSVDGSDDRDRTASDDRTGSDHEVSLNEQASFMSVSNETGDRNDDTARADDLAPVYKQAKREDAPAQGDCNPTQAAMIGGMHCLIHLLC